MKIRSHPVPSSAEGFRRLDTQINSSSRFANVYSLQRLRHNHNILMARRIRKVLFAHYGWGDIFSTLTPLDAKSGYVLCSVPVTITPGIKEIHVNVYGYATASGINIYPVVHAANSVEEIDTSVVISPGVAPIDTYGCDVPVAQQVQSLGYGRLTCYLEGGMSGTPSKGAAAFTDAGPDWILSAGAFTVGTALFFPTNAKILPRTVIKEVVVGGAIKTYVRGDFNITPDPASDTAASETLIQLVLSSISAYEKSRQYFFRGSAIEWKL